MATEVATLVAKLKADTADFDRNMNSAVGTLKKFAGPAAVGLAIKKLGEFAYSSAMVAADVNESVNAVEVVFGDAADTILDFSDTAIDSLGLTEAAVNKSATVLGSALQNAGFSAQEAADQTLLLTERAADMASVFNTDVDQALGAIQAALRGESDPIEKFGVSLNMAAVEAEALALGFEKVDGQFSNTEITTARLNLLMEQTDRVAGDYANTADSLANQQKRLNERFIESQAVIGEEFTPAVSEAMGVIEDVLPWITEFARSIAEDVGESMGAWIGLLGELTDEFGEVQEAGEEASNEEIFRGDFWRALEDPLSSISGMVDALVTAWYRDKQATDEATAATREAYEALDRGRHAAAGAGGAIDDLARDTREYERQADAARASAEKYADAINEIRNATLRSLDPALNLIETTREYDEVWGEVQQLIKNGKTGTDEYRDAAGELAVKQAELNAVNQQFATEDGQASVDVLDRLLGQAGLSKTAVDELTSSVMALSSALGGIPREVTFTVNGSVPGPGSLNPRAPITNFMGEVATASDPQVLRRAGAR